MLKLSLQEWRNNRGSNEERRPHHAVLFGNPQPDIAGDFIHTATIPDYTWLLYKSIRDGFSNEIVDEDPVMRLVFRAQLVNPKADYEYRDLILKFLTKSPYLYSSEDVTAKISEFESKLNASLEAVYEDINSDYCISPEAGELLDSAVNALASVVHQLEKKTAKALTQSLFEKTNPVFDKLYTVADWFSEPDTVRLYCMLMAEFQVQSIAELIEWLIISFASNPSTQRIIQEMVVTFRYRFDTTAQDAVFEVLMRLLKNGAKQHHLCQIIDTINLFHPYFHEKANEIFGEILVLHSHPANEIRAKVTETIIAFWGHLGQEQRNDARKTLCTLLKEPLKRHRLARCKAAKAIATLWPSLEQHGEPYTTSFIAFQLASALLKQADGDDQDSTHADAAQTIALFWPHMSQDKRKKAVQAGVVKTILSLLDRSNNNYESAIAAFEAADTLWNDLNEAERNDATQAIFTLLHNPDDHRRFAAIEAAFKLCNRLTKTQRDQAFEAALISLKCPMHDDTLTKAQKAILPFIPHIDINNLPRIIEILTESLDGSSANTARRNILSAIIYHHPTYHYNFDNLENSSMKDRLVEMVKMRTSLIQKTVTPGKRSRDEEAFQSYKHRG
ncbi:MAG: hypothetical protein V4496_04595 [Pseudomonadota bacterium]